MKSTKIKNTRDTALATVSEGERSKLVSKISAGLRDSAEAEDVYHEVLEDYIEAYDLGVVIESLSAWLVSVAQNKIIDRFRRKKTQTNYRSSVLEESGGMEPTSSESPDEEAWRANLRKELVAAVEHLPQEQREVFIAHEIEGKSFEEISETTGVKLNTLLSRKRYAVLELRELLKEIYEDIE